MHAFAPPPRASERASTERTARENPCRPRPGTPDPQGKQSTSHHAAMGSAERRFGNKPECSRKLAFFKAVDLPIQRPERSW
jgi:hypothetical protein